MIIYMIHARMVGFLKENEFHKEEDWCGIHLEL